MTCDILRTVVVEKVIDVPQAIVVFKKAAEYPDAAVGEDLKGAGLDHCPVNNGRGRISLLTCKAKYLLCDEVKIGGEFLRSGILVRPVGVICISVEGEPEPAGIVLPLAFVMVWKLPQIETISRGIIDIENKTCSVFGVKLLKDVQVETVEKRLIIIFGDVAQEEAVIIDGKAVARFGVFVPQYTDAMLAAAESTAGNGDNIILLVAENNITVEIISSPPGRGAINGYAVFERRLAADLDCQALLSLLAVTVVQNSAVKGVLNSQ